MWILFQKLKMIKYIIFICATLISLAAGETEYIENEYLLGLDGDLVRNRAVEEILIERLKTNFNVELVRSFHAGKLTVLYVRAKYDDVIQVSQLPEVRSVDQNGRVYAAQTCSEQPSPGM
jgi:general stress protein CsbA